MPFAIGWAVVRIFLSTYPVRGTTPRYTGRSPPPRHFYPRTPCGVRPMQSGLPDFGELISIHVPRAGYDYAPQPQALTQAAFLSTYPVRGTTLRADTGEVTFIFLSTYPVRGTTKNKADYDAYRAISIHVPRAGYDHSPRPPPCPVQHFYPRTPCGVRLRSLHLSHRSRSHFYPRTPCGVRHGEHRRGRQAAQISIHVPRAGYDQMSSILCEKDRVFLSTYPVRGTTSRSGGLSRKCTHFYPRTPCGVRRV